MSAPRGRYAPSPTGALHLGALRTALIAWLCARSAGGEFVLRIEDLDMPRTQPGAADKLLDDLRWLGLDWDEGPDVGGPYGPYVQSARGAIYSAALARLRTAGLLYPCYCTRAERRHAQDEAVASAPHLTGAPIPYSGACRELSVAERRVREAAGRSPSWRFRAPQEPVAFFDILHGEAREDVRATLGDIIVRRSDGRVAYNLAVVVDDALMGVTQVVRGADLLGVTAVQRALAIALGYTPPREYAHAPLAIDALGARLAKRDASAGVGSLRARGVAPERVVGALAASAGLCPAGESTSPRDLLANFDARRITLEPSRIVAPA
ncbi:MAG TPA: tRNA glutamyl-Q(34) synthetase GluQRS [Ktedonobacterales bacterium]